MADEQQARVESVMDDPSAQAIARVYATSFLDAMTSSGASDGLEEFSSFLDDVLAKNPEFKSLLLSAVMNRDEKIKLIDRVIAPAGSEFFTSFLRVLASHDRLDLLPQIYAEGVLQNEQRAGRRRVQISSPKPLSEESLQSIRQRLDSAFPFEPILETEIDPSLLGGLVIRVGDTVYDSSLRTRLKQLRIRLRERSLHEIQSGRDRFSHPEGD